MDWIAWAPFLTVVATVAVAVIAGIFLFGAERRKTKEERHKWYEQMTRELVSELLLMAERGAYQFEPERYICRECGEPRPEDDSWDDRIEGPKFAALESRIDMIAPEIISGAVSN